MRYGIRTDMSTNEVALVRSMPLGGTFPRFAQHLSSAVAGEDESFPRSKPPRTFGRTKRVRRTWYLIGHCMKSGHRILEFSTGGPENDGSVKIWDQKITAVNHVLTFMQSCIEGDAACFPVLSIKPHVELARADGIGRSPSGIRGTCPCGGHYA